MYALLPTCFITAFNGISGDEGRQRKTKQQEGILLRAIRTLDTAVIKSRKSRTKNQARKGQSRVPVE